MPSAIIVPSGRVASRAVRTERAVAPRTGAVSVRRPGRAPFAVALGLLSAACGSSDDTSPGAALPPGTGACNARLVESPPASAYHEQQCSDIAYATNPPSGGDHYGVWAAFQSYDVPVRPGFLVHSLEHGAIVFWYDCPEGCADEVAQVEAFIAALPSDPLCGSSSVERRAVLVPFPELESRWAASAWGFTLNADCFEPDEFSAFYSDHVGRAPENFCNNGQADVATRCP